MPNPKHKHSRARRDKRRTQKLRVTPPGMSVCPQCHELKLPHYTCLNCGTYKGMAVIQVEGVYSPVCLGPGGRRREAFAPSVRLQTSRLSGLQPPPVRTPPL